MVTEPATGLSFIELSHEWGHYTPAFPGYADIINSATYQYVATQGSFPGGVQGSNVLASQALVSGPGVRP
jgi:hypothetical protein